MLGITLLTHTRPAALKLDLGVVAKITISAFDTASWLIFEGYILLFGELGPSKDYYTNNVLVVSLLAILNSEHYFILLLQGKFRFPISDLNRNRRFLADGSLS